MDTTRIYERFCTLSKVAVGIDIPEYLKETNKSLYGILIADKGKSFRSMFGDPPNLLLEAANKRPLDAIAGYCIDVGDELRIPIQADILLLSDQLLLDTDILVDAIIVHELTHFALESGNDDLLRSEMTDEDRDIATRLHARTDRANERSTRHNDYYCKLLVVSCRRWAASINVTINEAIQMAMRFDVIDGFRQ